MPELTLYRRHAAACAHREKGRDFLKCTCPLWADGYLGRKRIHKALNTRDMAVARKRMLALATEDDRVYKHVADAIAWFLEHHHHVAPSTHHRYTGILGHLNAFCRDQGIAYVHELTVDLLDRFRASRRIAPSTAVKELHLLRLFFRFAVDRRWMEENPAGKIRAPRITKLNDAEPYTAAEIERILEASNRIGQQDYERLRARAMILMLRYTALRIGDVCTMERRSLWHDGRSWNIFLRTEKTGKPVWLPVPEELKDALDQLPRPYGAMAGEPKYFFWNGVSSVRSMKRAASMTLKRVFLRSGVEGAHAHRFRHTLATSLLEQGASFEEVADILGNTPTIVFKHYAKWSRGRQDRISDLVKRVHEAANYQPKKLVVMK